MCWIKVMFVMIIVIQLEIVQNKASADNTSTTEIINISTSVPTHKCDGIKAAGCLNGTILNLSLTYHPSKLTKWLVNSVGSKNCCKVEVFDNVLIVDMSCNYSSCIYNVSTVEGNGLDFLIKGSKFVEMDVGVCPETSELCVNYGNTFNMSLGEECPYFQNYSINTMLNDNKTNKSYLYLNITLDVVDKSIFTVEVMSKYEDENCKLTSSRNFYNATDEIIIPKALMDYDIIPNCDLDIVIEFHETDDCVVTYKVPSEIEGYCDEGHKPISKILSVEPHDDNKFKIHWDPGTKAANNKPYHLTKVNFFYSSAEIFSMLVEFVGKPNINSDTAIVIMKVFENENYTLHGTFINNYTCLGEDKFYFTAPPRQSFHLMFFVVLTLVLVVMAYLHKHILKYVKKLLGLIIPRYRYTFHQDDVALQPLQNSNFVPMSINTQYTPIEFLRGDFDEFEIPRNKIIIKEIIGMGAFGRVYSAKALEIGGCEGYQMVAVKTLGEGEQITREAADDFKAEIEIFKKIGKHPNIVSLLGCCTLETPCMMVMELVPCGDLKKYLLELREQWFAEKNKQVFFPDDNSDGAYIEPPSPTSVTSVTTSRLPSTSETVFTTLEDPLTPLLANYKHALEKVLDHKELQNFALQIARGMAHLEKIPITHRDLAARNILINEFKTLKISDFGMSRSGVYINQRTKKLPLRWMALEAIINQKYDSKSDVWSFGVVLWEIGTLGAFPYENVQDSMIQHFLQMGRRLERPEICTDELYSLMKQCWATDPNQRPTFQELVSALDVKAKKVYVNFKQLNPYYVFPPSDALVVKEVPITIKKKTLAEKEVEEEEEEEMEEKEETNRP
ncbi:mast/stem cell growth factor receptor Kit-like isoform X2 [Tribolium madens]|uniref:mast/stem cell growth factor receptor Kit-like isoform X2 n=1 Tax=Tribolium madens TaxID=41895 RepID=UPI001CF734B8|nr:mast/stem cell growth factor receptor Kit-like isoform X2 [Tribolium madens]